MTDLIRPADLPKLEPDHRLSIGATVLDFWRWAMSDLRMNNVRGYLAEFLVATAVGSESKPRVEWDDFDVETPDGIKVEVKSTGRLQSWTRPGLTTARWNIKSGLNKSTRWDEAAGKDVPVNPDDRVDVWVFALQACQEPETYNPLDVGQWEFRVAPHLLLRRLNQDSVGITTLEADPLNALPLEFERLHGAISEAAIRNKELSN